jgi:hypothetical protein
LVGVGLASIVQTRFILVGLVKIYPTYAIKSNLKCNFTTFKSFLAMAITLHQSSPQGLPSGLNNSAQQKSPRGRGQTISETVLDLSTSKETLEWNSD